jgi:polyvinyl alcohol dehydrogenase (cytochrome)
MSGYDLHGTRDFPSSIRAKDVPKLKILWNVSQCGGAVSPPSIKDGRVCSADYERCVSCYNTTNGKLIWRKNVSEFGLPVNIFARVTPTYVDNMLILVTSGIVGNRTGYGTWAFAVDFSTTLLVWKTQLSTNKWVTGTSSPLVSNGFVYIGLSSAESSAPIQGEKCCETVSKMFGLRVRNGIIVQTVPTIPPELSGYEEYSGVSIWGQMVKHGNHLYYTTGQLFHTPNASAECSANNSNNASCIPRKVLFDSIIKMEVSEGVPGKGGIVDSIRTMEADTWMILCIKLLGIPGCQPGPAKDYDVTNLIISAGTNQLFAACKSGIVWAVNLTTFKVNAVDRIVEGSIFGGYIYQGALRDSKDKCKMRLVLPNNNGDRLNLTLPNGTVVNTGVWVAYDGYLNRKWVTPAPGGGRLGDTAFAGVSITEDLVVTATRYGGLITFLDLEDGAILRTMETDGSMASTSSIGWDGIYFATGAGNLKLSFGRTLRPQNRMLKIGK